MWSQNSLISAKFTFLLELQTKFVVEGSLGVAVGDSFAKRIPAGVIILGCVSINSG